MIEGTKKLLFVIYDGIENSVFQSQVLKPLLDRLKENTEIKITLVSFETHKKTNKTIFSIIPAHPRLRVVMYQRIPFVSKSTLWFGVYQLKKHVKIHHYDDIIARGPLAGFISIKALNSASNKPSTVMVQARGLCAQEYRYAHLKTKQRFYKKYLHQWIYQALEKTEHEVFGYRSNSYNFSIESVSTALKNYLIKHFKSSAKNITIASKDIPPQINAETMACWKTDMRKKLSIPEQAPVYCYCGSFKPWQCAPETISYFAENLKKNHTSFMLILSQDKKKFEQEFARQNISKTHYAITSVQQKDLFEYLAAADFGMLFREKDVINWVSRPTKMLEYQAVGLKIVHNNTVAWLTK